MNSLIWFAAGVWTAIGAGAIDKWQAKRRKNTRRG